MQQINDLLEKLGADAAFLKRLKSDDDWTFIIKLHTLLEAAVNHAIVSHYGQELAGIVSHLDMNDPKRGKMAFIMAAKIFETHTRMFINSVSEMRNKCAHDIKHSGRPPFLGQFGMLVSGGKLWV